MIITYEATFAEAGTEASRLLNHEWSGAWYVAEIIRKQPPRIVSGSFKTEAEAITAAEEKTKITWPEANHDNAHDTGQFHLSKECFPLKQ